jgi:DNA adenine methylase
MVSSRAWFQVMEKTDPSTLTDIQRAARVLYLQKKAFAGRIINRNYGYSVTSPTSFNPLNIPETIEQAHVRLSRTQIECLPYENVLEQYDRPTTFFYCDPPYFDKPFYKFNLSESDYVLMAQRLAQIRGKFLLSLNDTSAVRKVFSPFRIDQVSLAYGSHRKVGIRFSELLISNY